MNHLNVISKTVHAPTYITCYFVILIDLNKYTHMTQIRDESTFTSNGVIKKLKYIDQHFVAFEARDLILSFSKNSAIMIFIKIKTDIFFHFLENS